DVGGQRLAARGLVGEELERLAGAGEDLAVEPRLAADGVGRDDEVRLAGQVVDVRARGGEALVDAAGLVEADDVEFAADLIGLVGRARRRRLFPEARRLAPR